MEFIKNEAGQYVPADNNTEENKLPPVGHPVNYIPFRDTEFATGGTYAAIITRHNDNGTVNLTIFKPDSNGIIHRNNVVHCSDNSEANHWDSIY